MGWRRSPSGATLLVTTPRRCTPRLRTRGWTRTAMPRRCTPRLRTTCWTLPRSGIYEGGHHRICEPWHYRRVEAIVKRERWHYRRVETIAICERWRYRRVETIVKRERWHYRRVETIVKRERWHNRRVETIVFCERWLYSWLYRKAAAKVFCKAPPSVA